MRIVTGKYKGRHFEIPRTFKARPTTDFAKENLFNVLRGYTDIEGKDVLDLFAGTGSITAEFLSRGSHFVSSYITHSSDTYDIIFADPPYKLPRLGEIPSLVLSSPILRPDGLLILEHGKNYDFSALPGFFDHRAYGSVNFSFFRHPAPAAE